jgi:signal transduction histidine kinase
MSNSPSSLTGTGLEVLDLEADPDFLQRQLHKHDVAAQMEGMQRLARAFIDTPDSLLQELVQSAIDLCAADSAGISLESRDGDDSTFNWVATAGKYAHFLNATLPSFPSAFAVCIERARPQIFRISKKFFDILEIEADAVTDGLLIPWEVDGTHGTIWVMAHGRPEAFDASDCRVMQMLANFAAMAVRQQRQQQLLQEQASASAAAAMANDLAHQINNPLQSLTNCAYIASENASDPATQNLARDMSADLERLSTLTRKLLAIPSDIVRQNSAAPQKSIL